MKHVPTILASLSIAVGIFGTLMILVVAMASGANSTPEQIHQLKLFMLGIGVAGLGCAVVGILLIIKGFPGWASAVGGLPMIVVMVVIAWLSIRSVR